MKRLLAGLIAIAVSATLPTGAAEAARPSDAVVLTGTYQAIGLSAPAPDADHDRKKHEHPRIDVLQVGDTQYRLKLPPKKRPAGGSVIRAIGSLSGKVMTASDIEVVGYHEPPPATGTTRVLAIRTYWTTTAPSTPTLTTTRSVLHTTGNAWFKDASYGQLGLSVTVVEQWVKISKPVGYCEEAGFDAMRKAEAAAKKLKPEWDAAKFHRTILYFPRMAEGCAPGWAYMPGTKVWLNGVMDKRISVHEQGHNYGLEHAHDYRCRAGGEIYSSLGAKTSCSYDEYGDQYDAMGSGIYTGHFSGYHKTQLKWMTGRTFAPLKNGTTYHLTPFEAGTGRKAAKIAVTTSRSYWMEWRRPIGMDAKLPAGATGGVLVHLRDPSIAPGPLLLDMSPEGDSRSAVLGYGRYWTSPEGIKLFVGTPTTSSVPIRVLAGSPKPTKPTAPRSVTTVAGDEKITVRWAKPTSDGGSSILDYRVTGTGLSPITVRGTATSVTVPYLTNGQSYSFTVTARNMTGVGTASAPTPAVKPVPANPSVTLGATPTTASRTVTLTATAAPNTVSKKPISYVEWVVDGNTIGTDETAPYSTEWDTYQTTDGVRTVTARAVDTNNRVGTASRQVTVSNPASTVSISTPAGTQAPGATTLLTATATPPSGHQVTDVRFFDGTREIGSDWDATGGWSSEWDTSQLWGARTVTAKVRDNSPSNKTGVSAPVTFTFTNDVAKGTLTSPAAGATVQGPVTLKATAVPASTGERVTAVYFLVNGYKIDYNSAVLSNGVWTQTWDTTQLYDFGAVSISVEAEYTVMNEGGWEELRSGISPGTRVTVQPPAPTARLTSPAAGGLVKPGATVTLKATATPNVHTGRAVQYVTFYDGAEQIGSDYDGSNGWSYQWNTYGRSRVRSLTAVASDWSYEGRSAPVALTMASAAVTATPVAYGGTTTVTGSLKVSGSGTALPGRPVRIQYRKRGYTGAWSISPTLTTGSAGTVTWRHTPNAHHDYRLYYTGSSPLPSIVSATRALSVSIKLVDALSKSTMTYGSTATLSGTVYPNLKDKTVYLQRYYSGAWRTQPGSKTLSTYSKFAFALKPGRGTYLYRVYVPKTTTLSAVYGPTRKLVVT